MTASLQGMLVLMSILLDFIFYRQSPKNNQLWRAAFPTYRQAGLPGSKYGFFDTK